MEKMKYLKNHNKGKNTRKIYRQNVSKYNNRYFIRYSKFLALYGIFHNKELYLWQVKPYYKFYNPPKYIEYINNIF